MHLNIGGVPEHFNLPWQLAIEEKRFQALGVNVNWNYYSGGTGEMIGKLDKGELDLAILLTEGYLSAVSKGLNAIIAQEYISSPLIWGIFTGSKSNIKSIYSPSAKRIAISRKGSGSHLMALIHAEQRGENIADYELIEIKSLAGAVLSLTNMESDLFYWEKYTTKPHIVSGELRMIGEFSAPWSSFLIVANKDSYTKKGSAINQVLAIINNSCAAFKNNPNIITELQKRFSMTKADAETWLDQTIWNTGYTIKRKSLQNAANALAKIDSAFDLHNFDALVSPKIQIR